ncbi:XRE family transcriptional regulator [Saccharopolyspora rhizosphaerae]|uniref:XRE family transcriptional regulator n=1 Tax=Saccharopolyspora rhizosphaerae TaxID=2492662 RepID=A0A3R8PXX5_9PSEU|nr:helix-turn-helix transcriptional regulator [Saccharopolyspora rhizosphaerae]RRO14267.1 XRE family transcriptional regulator [Saccharopolyspora rhizosphaerae]
MRSPPRSVNVLVGRALADGRSRCEYLQVFNASVNFGEFWDSGEGDGVMARPGSRNDTGELGSRLRELRESRGMTQLRLGRALGVAVSSISSWESGAKLPPPARLADYATFFASGASSGGVPPENALTDEQREQRLRLKRELDRLRTTGEVHESVEREAQQDFWRFPDDGPVRIVTGGLSEKHWSPLGTPSEPNFLSLARCADLDAAVELFGHVRAANPRSDVEIRLEYLGDDDLRAHLVFLGSGAANPWVEWLTAGWPVRQVPDEEVVDGSVFLIDGERRLKPVFRGDQLVEDVGLLARIPNPNNIRRTLTFCSGVFTRGGFGAVRCLTDPQARDRNLAYLHDNVEDLTSFGMLMRVPVMRHVTGTPDLQNPANRLYEW